MINVNKNRVGFREEHKKRAIGFSKNLVAGRQMLI
jgi:hypothetical protein